MWVRLLPRPPCDSIRLYYCGWYSVFNVRFNVSKMKSKVVNKKHEGYDVYIGRPSKWGNPFKIGMEYKGRTLARKDAIAAHEDWFLYSDEGNKLQQDLHELAGKVLGCWCKPWPCHGDTLIECMKEKGLIE